MGLHTSGTHQAMHVKLVKLACNKQHNRGYLTDGFSQLHAVFWAHSAVFMCPRPLAIPQAEGSTAKIDI
jgi:hypothetical protein